MSWNRKLWGIRFKGADGSTMIVGAAWYSTHTPNPYRGEPTRALLFCNREEARKWCAEKQRQYESRKDTLSKWRFTPIRVKEIVVVLGTESRRA